MFLIKSLANEFVLFEEAELAKQKGFDEVCFGFYNTISDGVNGEENPLVPIKENSYYKNSWFHPAQVCAPTYQQVFDWLRIKHGVHVYLTPFDEMVNFQPAILYKWAIKDVEVAPEFATFEQSRITLVKRALKHLSDQEIFYPFNAPKVKK